MTMKQELQAIQRSTESIREITQEIKDECNDVIFNKATKKVAKLNTKNDGWEYLLFDNVKANSFDIFRQNRNGAENFKVYKKI